MKKYLLLILFALHALQSHAQVVIVYSNSDWKELRAKLKQAEGISTVQDIEPRPLKNPKLTLEDKIKLLEVLGKKKEADELKKQLSAIKKAEVKHQQKEKDKAEVKLQQEKKDFILPNYTPPTTKIEIIEIDDNFASPKKLNLR